jgi:hypothetical protein
MEMQTVSSSDISAIGYDFDSATLRIDFIKSGLYEYYGVSQELYEGLMDAPSKGQYLNQNIKKGGYSYAKL